MAQAALKLLSHCCSIHHLEAGMLLYLYKPQPTTAVRPVPPQSGLYVVRIQILPTLA